MDLDEPGRKAAALLKTLRQTRMLRGGRSNRNKQALREKIADAIEGRGVLTRLADRVALQVVLKFDVAELGDRTVWANLGEVLRRETEQLRTRAGLVNRQIIVGLPKLSADQIEAFLGELQDADPKIARTILNAALDAADPLPTGRRYLAEFHRVAEQLENLDPRVARTLANATFMARAPTKKSMDHFKQFANLVMKFQDDVDFARTVAREAFRAPNPLKAAQGFIALHDAIVVELSTKGVGTHVAKSLAGIASVCAEPMATAHRLLASFEDVRRLVKKTHPWVARSIALSACRATDPSSTARSYMKNYDTIVRLISRTDPLRARDVACQAFRTDKPMQWAKRYLAELQETRSHVGERQRAGQTSSSQVRS